MPVQWNTPHHARSARPLYRLARSPGKPFRAGGPGGSATGGIPRTDTAGRTRAGRMISDRLPVGGREQGRAVRRSADMPRYDLVDRRPHSPWVLLWPVRRRSPKKALHALLLGALVISACSKAANEKTVHSQAAPHSSAQTPAAAEADRAGDPQWNQGAEGEPRQIEGFADHDSVRPGEKVKLFVSTTSQRFRVTSFRMGWYRGARARKVWNSDWQQGTAQADPQISGDTHTPSAPWKPSLTVDTADWPAGDYLMRLDTEGEQAHRFVPLVVRSASMRGALVVVNANTTWQAYNDWGEYSLYHGPSGGRTDRARAVTFDRPYSYGAGAGDFIGAELPLLALAEKMHLPLGYATDVDLHRFPNLLKGARGMLSLGHDEYWSTDMRDSVTHARDSGMNVGFFGANALYRKIRWGDTKVGSNRLEINYKDDTDPIGSKDKNQVTTQWRSEPSNDPESSLTGTFYQCNPVRADMVVVDPNNWLYSGLGLKSGSALPGVVGSEYDRVDLASPTPHPIEVLTHSPVDCGGRADHADSAYYTTKAGSGVFNAGTSDWVSNIDSSDPTVSKVLTQVTSRLLKAFAAGPAGRQHPAHDNTKALYATD